MVNNHTSYPASDRSFFALLIKGIRRQAIKAGFSETKIGHIELILAEITSNLSKHAAGGEILCGLVGEGDETYLEIICIDNGPGMVDLPAMVIDGASTVNTLGHGLGSIKRLSDYLSIYTQVGWGTVLLTRISKTSLKKAIQPILISPLIVAKPLETVSGDGCIYKFTKRYFILLILDGLGHGIEANKAVIAAFESFEVCPFFEPEQIIRYLHQSLKKTRGGVGTVIVYDLLNETYKILGVGNISTKTIEGTEIKNILSYNGTIGHIMPITMNSHVISSKNFKYLILCSDGIKSRWDLLKHPKLLRYDPMIMAAVIYKDFGCKTDDVSVIILKINEL